MTGSKILWGQMLMAVLAVGGMLWAATEWTAWRLGFQPALGAPWFSFAHWPVYPPHQFFAWWLRFDSYAPALFLQGAGIACSGGVIAVVVAIGASIQRSRLSARVTTYGSARWAGAEDVRAAGLLEPAGVYLGRLGRQHLRHAGPEHVRCFAPTRSGKGTIARMLAELVGRGHVAGPTLASLGTNFGLSPLLGKPLAIVSDARLGNTPADAVVERLLSITGEDMLTVDRKFKEPWSGKLSTRFVILSNELPKFRTPPGRSPTVW
jgi:hypothetical protein